MESNANAQVTFSAEPTPEEVRLIQKGLDDYNNEQTQGAYDNPGIEINLALKDNAGNVVGGLNVSTMLRVMHLEVFWVAQEYRKLGYGRDLVLAAERIGRENGCILSHTWTFSFQAPGFYQKIGYEVVAIYEGYPDGITEYVLRKSLQRDAQALVEDAQASSARDAGRFSITENATPEEMRVVSAGLHDYILEQTRDGNYAPGKANYLVVRERQGQVVGGLLAWMGLRSIVIEQLWLDEGYRGRGYGRKLLLEAERVAREYGCIACQTYALSFQSPGFFRKLGYETFGIDDGYPDPIEEHYFIKRL